MTDDKKDLTNLLQYSKKLQESGQLPEAPQGSVLEEIPIEKIDDFESLEAYAASNPLPEPGSEPPAEETPQPELEATPEPEIESEQAPASEAEPEPQPELSMEPPSSEVFPSFDVTPESTFEPAFTDSNDFAPSPPETLDPLPQDLFTGSDAPPPSDPFAPTPDSLQAEPAVTPPEVLTPPTPVVIPPPSAPPPASLPAAPPPAQAPTSGDKNSLQNLRKFSENTPIGKPTVPAAFPFSLMITGTLLPEEKEKLLDILNREKMGFREIDLEPQLATGRVLIPRISEYAGILLVQALRAARAQFRFGPSDTIFSSKDATSETEDTQFVTDESNSSHSIDPSHPAETLPVTPAQDIPQIGRFRVMDTITASAILKSPSVEVENTSDYQDMVDALQKEVKYKAFRKGAHAVTHFKVQLTYLSTPTHYRLTAMGTAVQAVSSSPDLPEKTDLIEIESIREEPTLTD